MRFTLFAFGLLFTSASAGCTAAKPAPSIAASAPNHAATPRGDSYYLSTCAVCDRALGYVRPAIDTTYQDRSLRFCSEECETRFHADPAAGTAHIDAVIMRDQLPHYPISVSIVSGRSLGSAPVDFVWCNRLVRVSNASERATFLGDPERYLTALDEQVILIQTPTYGMPDRCPVQGDILASDTPIDIVVANRMVRVCCARCVRNVKARPYQYLALVDYANKEAAAKAGRED